MDVKSLHNDQRLLKESKNGGLGGKFGDEDGTSQ